MNAVPTSPRLLLNRNEESLFWGAFTIIPFLKAKERVWHMVWNLNINVLVPVQIIMFIHSHLKTGTTLNTPPLCCCSSLGHLTTKQNMQPKEL